MVVEARGRLALQPSLRLVSTLRNAKRPSPTAHKPTQSRTGRIMNFAEADAFSRILQQARRLGLASGLSQLAVVEQANIFNTDLQRSGDLSPRSKFVPLSPARSVDLDKPAWSRLGTQRLGSIASQLAISSLLCLLCVLVAEPWQATPPALKVHSLRGQSTKLDLLDVQLRCITNTGTDKPVNIHLQKPTLVPGKLTSHPPPFAL